VLQPAVLCMQFADSEGNIADSTLYTSFFYFQNYSSVFRDNLKSKGLFHVTATGTIMLHYLKGLLAPLCFSSKRYQFLLAVCKAEKSAKIKEYWEYLPQLAKGSLITFIVIEKGYQIPLRANCMRNPWTVCNAVNVIAIFRWENFKKMKASFKVPRFLYQWKPIQFSIYLYFFQDDLMWSDGTFTLLTLSGRLPKDCPIGLKICIWAGKK
jgi:hypothetical protein